VSLFKWVAVAVLSVGLGAVQAVERDFTLSDANGVTHDLKKYRGKWVVVNYWATWCPPCLEEIPDLVKFHEKHKDLDAVVIGVDYEDIPAQQLDSFVKKLGVSYPIMQADPSVNPEFGDVPGLPTTFMINPQGELVAKQTGPLTITALESYIRRKSAAPPKPPITPVAAPALVPGRGL
jgi:thiol-disulfide isomerase/thioredoxin